MSVLCELWIIFDSKTFTHFLKSFHLCPICLEAMWFILQYIGYLVWLYTDFHRLVFIYNSLASIARYISNNIEKKTENVCDILAWLFFTNWNWCWTMFFLPSNFLLLLLLFCLLSENHTYTYTRSQILTRREISMSQNFACKNYVKWK